jgi:hypothetical protein
LKDTEYFRQANLVLSTLPIINSDPRFALKGGTTINFFFRPLPRLSVDIDLTYLSMNELLNPSFLDISHQFEYEFEGMMFNRINLDEFYNARENLVTQLLSGLTESEKEFLISVKSKKPNWDLIDVEHVKDLPAVKWKLLNLEKMDKNSHKEALTKLIKILE